MRIYWGFSHRIDVIVFVFRQIFEVFHVDIRIIPYVYSVHFINLCLKKNHEKLMWKVHFSLQLHIFICLQFVCMCDVIDKMIIAFALYIYLLSFIFTPRMHFSSQLITKWYSTGVTKNGVNNINEKKHCTLYSFKPIFFISFRYSLHLAYVQMEKMCGVCESKL